MGERKRIVIVFTAIGLLWFWLFCFQVGYYMEPGFYTLRALIVTHLLGREAERLVATLSVMDYRAAATGGKTE